MILTVSRTISDTGESGDKFEFVIPDMMKLMNTTVVRGDEFSIPVSTRENQLTFWESGGRNERLVSAIGTIIASESDQLLDAILFNKLNKIPNGKQALIALRPGYRLYAGKLSSRDKSFVPQCKIIRFIFQGVDKTASDEKTTYGRFVVDALFTDYGSVKGCLPAERLVEKLYSKDVKRPYFTNGWSITNIARIKDKNTLKEQYRRIVNLNVPIQEIPIANQFIDAVEESIIRMNNKNLSAVFQYVDFETGMLVMLPLIGMLFSDITGTVDKASVNRGFSIPMANMSECYNPNIMFGSTDIPMLEMALLHDDKYAIRIESRLFACIRGYRG